MNNHSRKAVGVGISALTIFILGAFAAPVVVPFINAVIAHTPISPLLIQGLITSGGENYLHGIIPTLTSPDNRLSVAIMYAVLAALMLVVSIYSSLQTPSRNVEDGVLGNARIIYPGFEQRRKNDHWNGKGIPKRAGLVLSGGSGGYLFDSSIPHYMTIGKTGSGKSQLMVIETLHLLMAAAWNVICTGKSELLELTGEKAVELGYKRVVFDLRGYPGASRFNPIDLIADYAENNQVAEAQRTARQTAMDIVPLEGNNDYFPKAARSELAAVILLVAFADIPREQKNMATVCEVINRGTTGTGRDPSAPLKDYIRSLGPSHPAYSSAKQFLADGGLTTAGKNVGTTLDEALTVFNDEGMRELTSKSDVSIRDIVRDNTIIYMHLLEDGDPYQVLYTAFLNQYWRVAQQEALLNSGRLPHETAIVGDEWGNLPKVAALGEIVTLGRSMKLHAYLFAQDLKQLNKYNKPGDNGAGRDKILGSMGGKVALSLANPEDFSYFTKLVGKRTVLKHGINKQHSGTKEVGNSQGYNEEADDLIHEWEWQAFIPVRDGSTVIKGGENSKPGREGVFRMALDYANRTPAGKFFGLGSEEEEAQKRFDFRRNAEQSAKEKMDCALPWCPDFNAVKSGSTIGYEIEDDEFGAWDGLE